MKQHELLIKKATRKALQKEALKETLISESILDMLVSAILGPFIQYKADKFKNSKEYKELISKIKKLDKEGEALHKKANDAYNEFMEKYGPKGSKKSTNLYGKYKS